MATTATVPTKADAKVLSGGSVTTRSIDLGLFGTGRRRTLLKEAAIAYQANQRQGTHKAKKRAETSYSEAKPWPQKHTGRARAGDRNSPLWRHGGTIFGPIPRDYRQSLPRRALREALRSALWGKLVDGEVAVIEKFAGDKPSTKTAAKCLKELGIAASVTVVAPTGNPNVLRSFRNLERCDVVPAAEVNALHLLRRKHVVFVGDALDTVGKRLAGKAAPSA
ncbi:MAG: 50S ribosomal protein L4 [Planctomycetes bacterium]|nr:50S ribosomal protein L4 [Planctomycetota bacterium]